MKKRKIGFIIIAYILLATFGMFCGVLVHEAGHALGALLFGVPITKVKIGLESYVQINVAGVTNFELAVISIGSFVSAEIVFLLLILSKNVQINIIRIFFSMLLYVEIFLSVIVLITGSKHPETWDILAFQKESQINTVVIIAGLILMLIINIVLEIHTARIKNTMLYIAEKI